MRPEAFLERLENVRSRGTHKWSARCPGHADRSPSLSISEVGNRILVHCFAGCDPGEIVEALGLTMADLFTDCPGSTNQEHPLPPQKLDLIDVAFRFELGALDRRLRAERVMTAAQQFHPDELTDPQLERTMNAIASAYADLQRAEFLESVADRLRMHAYPERIAPHAA